MTEPSQSLDAMLFEAMARREIPGLKDAPSDYIVFCPNAEPAQRAKYLIFLNVYAEHRCAPLGNLQKILVVGSLWLYIKDQKEKTNPYLPALEKIFVAMEKA